MSVVNPLIVQATLSAAFAVLAEAALSFLGLGAQPPAPSWGQDINYSRRYLANWMWWMSAVPGLAIFLAVFAFNFLGDALRDALDPHLRRLRDPRRDLPVEALHLRASRPWYPVDSP